MKLLWIINIPLPPLCECMGWNKPVLGGWLYSSLRKLLGHKDIEITVACPYSSGKNLVDKNIGGIRYFAIPYKGYSLFKKYAYVREYWKYIYDEIKPDVIHIHGTEFALGNDFISVNGVKNVIVSIQGLVSVIAPYYLGGISKNEICKNITLRDFLRHSSILNEQAEFVRRGYIEIDTIRRINYVIGRTAWDRSHIWAINPSVKYFNCEETLRDSFYFAKWDYNNCERHSIFISQAGYPIKGLHKVLMAMPLVVKHYPDTKIYIAGSDITRRRPWYRFTGYGNYIKTLIEKYNLFDRVEFTGPLDEKHMCERYLKSNLFICSSIIENSPNSLGEAQVLGVPVLASYVGGIPDMMKEDEIHLYRFDDIEMLAYKICEVFKNEERSTPPQQIRYNALCRHSPDNNMDTLIKIYKSVNQDEVGTL